MLPILFSIGPIKIYTFGVFLVLGFFWSLFILWKNIRLTSYKEEEIFDGLFISLAVGLFFSRLFYVVLNFSDFGFDILKFILINGYPGLSLYGGLFGLFLSLWLFLNGKKIKFIEAIDYFITPVFIALFFGKIGGFLSGVEMGANYEAIFYLLSVFLSEKILLEIRKEKFFKGFLFYFFIWYFSLTNFLFDKIKGNHLYFSNYNFNKLVSFIFLLTTSVYFVYYFRSDILSFIKKYGQIIISKIHFRTKRKTTKG